VKGQRMRHSLKTLFAVVCLTSSVMAQEAKQQGPLAIELPAGWEMKYKGDGIDFYTLTSKGEGLSLLMLSRWPMGGGKDKIPALMDQLSKSFAESAKNNKDINLTNPDAKPEDLGGENFSGKYVLFEIDGGVVQAMYMVSDGTDIWNGQFSGSKEQWTEALGIIRKLKRNG